MRIKRLSYPLAALAVIFAPLLTTSQTQPAEATTPAAIDCGSKPYNHREYNGRHINLWKCYGIPGSHGPMYHAQTSNAVPSENAIIRYRTTHNNAELDNKVVPNGWTYVNTDNFYANPDEVQACAWVADYGCCRIVFLCAWTENDGDG